MNIKSFPYFFCLLWVLAISFYSTPVQGKIENGISKSKWHEGDRYDFKFQGRDAIVVVPQKAAAGNPWIWRPAFFEAFPAVE